MPNNSPETPLKPSLLNYMNLFTVQHYTLAILTAVCRYYRLLQSSKFVTFTAHFVPLAVEFIAFAIEYGSFAIQFIG